MQTKSSPSATTECCPQEKPGFFARLWQKLDNKMKAKAEKQSGCCCGCGDDKPQDSKSGKCC